MTVSLHSRGKGAAGAVVKGSVATFVLFFLSMAVPLLAVPAGALVPFPSVFYTIRHGRLAGYCIVAVMLCSLAFVDHNAIHLYLLQSIACSLLLPELLVRGKGALRSLLFVVVSNAVVIAGYAFVLGFILHIDIDGQVSKIVGDVQGAIGEAFRQGGMSGEDLKGLQVQFAQAKRLLVRIYPSLILLYTGFVAGINLLILRRVSGVVGRPLHLGRFRDYRNPDVLVWFLIASGFALLSGVNVVDRVALNFLVLILALYLVQGVAVVVWFCGKHSIPRFVQFLFFLLILFQPIIAATVAAIGLFDLWADFRAPKIKENL